MTSKPPPPWLAELQSRFGAVLRTPLDRSTGTLRATPAAYDVEALGDALDGPRAVAAERLAVYNRQYWFRLFTVFQTAFPLAGRLLGHWTLNDFAARFLLAHPPRSWDLDRAPDGFDDWLAVELADVPARAPVVEAARLDAAWRGLFRAPSAPPFRPSAEDAARLLDARLIPSPAVALVVERWALLELKHTLAGDRGESPVPPPPRHSRPRWWALAREPGGVRHLPLDAREGELLDLLRRHTVRDALAELEAACDAAERAELPLRAQRWLAQSVERGVWCGLRVEPEGQGTTQV